MPSGEAEAPPGVLAIDPGTTGQAMGTVLGLNTLLPDPNNPTKYVLIVGPDLPAGIVTVDVIAVDARGNETEVNVDITMNPCNN